MANIADRYQIDESISGQNQEEWKSFTNDKNVSYVVDQQNGNYSNQVSWDLTSVVSQNAWMSLQESYILMPFSTILSTTAMASTTPINANTVAIKNNFLNFIDSIQMFVNGEQVIDQTSFSNMPLQILDMLTMSQDDLKLKGSSLNIAPDTTTSIRYPNSSASTSGDGITNNVFLSNSAATTLTSTDYSLFNTGLQQRVLNTSANPSLSANLSNAGTINAYPVPIGTTTSVCPTATLNNYFSSGTQSSATNSAAWNYVVYLPLKRMSDLLAKYPLIKGSQIRLVVNFNSCVSAFNVTNATAGLMKMTSNTQTAGNCNPIMVTNSLVNLLSGSGTTSAFTLTTAIQTKTQAQSGTSPQLGYNQLPNCRIYVPSYKINAQIEERMLSSRTQRIRYNDWYQQPTLKTTNNGSYSQVLTTALTNVKYLIGVPFQNGSSGLFNSFTGSQFNSVFDTAPATSLPNGMLAFQNFNVSVSGINVFNQNQNYNYDNWVQEVSKVGLNGGLSRELSSGLLDFTSWSWSPFIVCDLSRRPESADGTYQSVVVNGLNSSGVTVDIYWFICFEKEIELDIVTGAVKRIF